MSKSNHFSTKSVFGQLISLIDEGLIGRAVKKCDSDRYTKRFKTKWQIELLFKQLKQNFPLKYFLGDNENAIKIQIYCVLIVNLLLAVIKKRLKRNWAFSNLVSFCKIHLFNHINLMKFLENPEKDWEIERLESVQLTLF